MSQLKEVYRAASPVQSALVVALLEQHGLQATTQGETLYFATGEVPLGWPTAPRVMVREEDYEKARAVVVEWEQSALEEKDDTSDEPTWDCPECGEEVDFSFEMCWNCQYNRTAC